MCRPRKLPAAAVTDFKTSAMVETAVTSRLWEQRDRHDKGKYGMTSGHGKRRCHDPGTVIATAVTALERSLGVRFVVPSGGLSRASPLPLGGGGGAASLAGKTWSQDPDPRFPERPRARAFQERGAKARTLVAAAAQPGEPLNRRAVADPAAPARRFGAERWSARLATPWTAG